MESPKVVLTFHSEDKILCCYHSNETSSAVLSHGTVYLVLAGEIIEYKMGYFTRSLGIKKLGKWHRTRIRV